MHLCIHKMLIIYCRKLYSCNKYIWYGNLFRNTILKCIKWHSFNQYDLIIIHLEVGGIYLLRCAKPEWILNIHWFLNIFKALAGVKLNDLTTSITSHKQKGFFWVRNIKQNSLNSRPYEVKNNLLTYMHNTSV